MSVIITLFLFGMFLYERWTPAAGIVTWTITALLLLARVAMAAQGKLLHQRMDKLEKELAQKK